MLHETLLIFPIVISVLFILAIRGLSSPSTSVRGNRLGMIGMALAVLTVLFSVQTLDQNLFHDLRLNINFNCLLTLGTAILGGGVGYLIAKKVNMTQLPQLLAAFHSLVGLAAVLISAAIALQGWNDSTETFALQKIELSLGASIGAITFIGSLIAFAKLQGILRGTPLHFKGHNKLNIFLGILTLALIIHFVSNSNMFIFLGIVFLSLILGCLLIMPIGGADMPVVISMLNSYSGWAAAGIGFSSNNNILVIIGAIVGTSGAILSHIMCKGMNRSLINVIFGGISNALEESNNQDQNHGNVKLCAPEDAGFILKNAGSVIIVPGYGMAVAQAQHVIKELADKLKSEGVSLKYAIHPVAGRMPGHMNVLLAEANIPYDDVFEINDVNHEFGSTDVAVVIGANDITNPAAKNDPNSPIYGMPVLDVEKAKTVLFVKRSLGAGYAGIENQLFYRDNTMMVLGDAKKVCENILKSISE